MGIGHSEKKGRERAGEINRIRRIQLAQRRSEFKKKKKKDVKEMGYKPRNQTQSAREKKPRRKGKLSRKNKETEVGIAHVNEAGWPWRIKKNKKTVAGCWRSPSATVLPVSRSLARSPFGDL